MATLAKTARGEAAAAKERQPAAYIEPHGGGERVEAVAPTLVRQALRAWELVKRVDALEQELKGSKEALAQALGTGVSLVVPGVCRVSVASSSSASIADEYKLRTLLADEWEYLVESEIKNKPTARLLEMASDGDHPLAPSIRALLKVRQSTVVRITAEK